MQNNQYRATVHLIDEEINQEIEKILHPNGVKKKRYFISSEEINQDIEMALHAHEHNDKKKKCLTLNEEINQEINSLLHGNDAKKKKIQTFESNTFKSIIDDWQL